MCEMKKISNLVCIILIVIGLFVAIGYAGQKETNTVKEKYENGALVTDENGNQAYVQYFDMGQTKSKAQKKKIYATVGFMVYAGAVIGTKYFIDLSSKTKEDVEKMKNDERELLL